MKKAKVVSAIALSAILILGVLAASVYAKGKPPKPEPILDFVDITGGIEGRCDNSAEISIEFLDDSFGEQAGSFVANPDYPPALEVGGPGKNRRLTYYYCDHPDHQADGLEENTICAVGNHSPYYYKELMISRGKVTSKRGEDFTVVFPAGSTWRIGWKETMQWEYMGTLAMPVTYKEVYE